MWGIYNALYIDWIFANRRLKTYEGHFALLLARSKYIRPDLTEKCDCREEYSAS
jgi:hypothetical protein